MRAFFLSTVVIAMLQSAPVVQAQARIEVAPDGRHLQEEDGKPFFYLGGS